MTQTIAFTPELTAKEYRELNAVSRSAFVDFLDSPKLYKMKHLDRVLPSKKSRDLAFGNGFHAVVLEGSPVAHEFIRIPPEVLGKGGAKSTNAYRDFESEHAGKVLCDDREFWEVDQMLLAIAANDAATAILAQASIREQSILWQDGELPFMRCCRPDLRLPHLTCDLKTAHDASPKAFAAAVLTWSLHVQDRWYTDGIEAVTGERPPFCFIVCQKTPPFACEVYDLGEQFKRLAREVTARGLERLAGCYEMDDWSSDTNGEVITLEPPGWALTNHWEIAR